MVLQGVLFCLGVNRSVLTAAVGAAGVAARCLQPCRCVVPLVPWSLLKLQRDVCFDRERFDCNKKPCSSLIGGEQPYNNRVISFTVVRTLALGRQLIG